MTITVGDIETGFYIEDDEAGIPAEEREDLFKAGFSTTAEGRGFELGVLFVRTMSRRPVRPRVKPYLIPTICIERVACSN